MTTSQPTRRVMINTDAKNEADDQFAIVHALLSETLDVRGLIAAHFGDSRSSTSMLDSRKEIDLLLDHLSMDVPVENGAAGPIPDERTPAPSAGAQLIVDEAKKDEGPLMVAFLGPLTDMASALLMEPSIADADVTVIWIGGAPYGDYEPEKWPEFNLSNDVPAANVVFRSGIDIWQVPWSTYVRTAVGYAELDEKVAPCGPLGRYLVDQLREWNATWVAQPIEHRALGDSPAVGLMLNPAAGIYRRIPAPTFSNEGGYLPGGTHTVRVYEQFDTRYLLEDFFAKLRRWTSSESS